MFEPTFKDFEVVILNVYDVMIKASQQVPRVETKLYLDWVSEVVILNVYKFLE